MPTPHRMGAALTYARRYGLFTLVGIAGEDDLDAPDLPLQSAPRSANSLPAPVTRARAAKTASRNLPKPVVTLDLEASGRQRDELLVEVAAISSFDGAAEWAKRIIPIKNTLTSEHAREVEAALEIKLAQIGDRFGGAVQTSEARTDGPNCDRHPAAVNS